MPLTGDQYQSVMRVINERELAAERACEDRKRETFARLPELKKLKDEVTSAGVTATKKYMAGDRGAREAFDRIRKTAAEMEAAILAKEGLPADYLEPQYTCPDCHDTGIFDDGTPCHCFTQLAYDIIYSQDRLRYWLSRNSFGSFDLSLYSDAETDPVTGETCRTLAERALGTAAAFVYDMTGRPVHGSPAVMAAVTASGKCPAVDAGSGSLAAPSAGTATSRSAVSIAAAGPASTAPSGPALAEARASVPNLVIYGSTGTGKTFLTHCITGEVMDAGKTCIYLTAAEFVDVAEQAEFKHQPEDFRNCFTCDLLVIDDLGTELVNTFTSGVVYRVVNERILNRKSTVISTNLMLDQLQTTYSDRTFSRLGGNYKFIRLVGADHRVE